MAKILMVKLMKILTLTLDGFCSGDLDEKAPVQTSYKGITKDQRSSTVNVNESALKKSPNAKQ
jgi:hypothetical protein